MTQTIVIPTEHKAFVNFVMSLGPAYKQMANPNQKTT